MESRKFNNTYAIKLHIGEELITTLTDFFQKENFQSFAKISAIGAAKDLQLGYFQKDHTYLKKNFHEDLEIVALNGNLTLLDNQLRLHLHGAFGQTNFQVIGGHVFQLVCAMTVEIFVEVIDTKPIYRKIKNNDPLPCWDLQ